MDYPNSGERLANIRLTGLKQGELSTEEMIPREFNVAAVNSFEGKHADGADL